MRPLTTQDVIDELMNAFSGENANARQRYVLEQSLHNLVRLAKTEQLMEIRSSVKKLSGTMTIKHDDEHGKLIHRH